MKQNEKYLQIIDEERMLYERVAAANRALEAKAATLLQASSIVIALVTAAQVVTDGLSGTFSLIIVTIILVLFLFMIGLALWVWRPRDKRAPFNNDWDNLFNRHIYAEDEEDLKVRLANYVDAISDARDENKKQAELITVAGVCFGAQIFALILLFIFS